MDTFNHWIEKLGLQPHPEGGYYAESYRATEEYSGGGLPERYEGSRSFSTAIYFLLTAGNPSHFHRVASDEGWHFYDGSPLRLHILSPEGDYLEVKVGCEPEKNILPQYVVPAGYWFAAEMMEGGAYSLVGCTVAPGFDFQDFELANEAEMLKQFPQHAQLLKTFCIAPNS